MSITNVHTYAGDGISIGTGIDGGTSNILVNGLYQNGEPLTPAGGQSGIKLKSNTGVGGLVSNIVYENVCMQNEVNDLYINSSEGIATGNNYPQFGTATAPIVFRNITVLPNSAVTSRFQLKSYGANYASNLVFDNLNFTFTPTIVSNQYNNITLTGGPDTPASIENLTGPGVTVTGAPTKPYRGTLCLPGVQLPSTDRRVISVRHRDNEPAVACTQLPGDVQLERGD